MNERELLDDLRARFERLGYRFEFEPHNVPTFFEDYRPDAIAVKDGRNVAIVVKRQLGPSAQRSLQRIRDLLDGHPEWELRVVFTGGDLLEETVIAPASPSLIRHALDDIHVLIAESRLRLAFVSAWSLLEACSAHLRGGAGARPSRPEAVVQSLAAAGFIDAALERHLHDLVALRNRIVHGDLETEPTRDDVAVVLAGVDEAVGAMAS